MDAIIVLAISTMGCNFYNLDFCTLYTFISISNTLYKKWINYTIDKTAKR